MSIENNEMWAKSVEQKLIKKLSRTAVSAREKIPYTSINGTYDDQKGKHWTNGFWPALMLLMYKQTENKVFYETAEYAIEYLDKKLFTYGTDHDLGFLWNISAGFDYRLIGNKESRNRFLLAADQLMGRYNCRGEFIRAWNGDKNIGVSIIDCMMNLPLLYRASEEIGDRRYEYVANAHADKTLKYHVRQDGACYHIVEYNSENGEFIKSHTGQGYSQTSAWSRGQAWGIYGFALAYRYTKNIEYLNCARRIADYFTANIIHTNYIPLCDFRQPSEVEIYDSTAGACAACGMLEISKFLGGREKSIYIDTATSILKSLEENCCDWSEDEDAILLKGTERYTDNIHIPIIYGDYFFAEGIYRLLGYDSDVLW